MEHIKRVSELKSFFMNSEINSTDKNKIFTIPFHQIIAKRIDPNYYSFKFEELEHKLNSSKWELKQLGEICEISRGGSPRPIKKYITEDSDGINWIKIGDTKDINKYIYSTKINKSLVEKIASCNFPSVEKTPSPSDKIISLLMTTLLESFIFRSPKTCLSLFELFALKTIDVLSGTT